MIELIKYVVESFAEKKELRERLKLGMSETAELVYRLNDILSRIKSEQVWKNGKASSNEEAFFHGKTVNVLYNKTVDIISKKW